MFNWSKLFKTIYYEYIFYLDVNFRRLYLLLYIYVCVSISKVVFMGLFFFYRIVYNSEFILV